MFTSLAAAQQEKPSGVNAAGNGLLLLELWKQIFEKNTQTLRSVSQVAQDFLKYIDNLINSGST
jgi:hypothetical protein